MKELFDKVSYKTSQITTHTYSTSFSLGIRFLHPSLREPIYNIYGFVRSADEIVDSFHGYNQQQLFEDFRVDTWKAIDRKIGLNPVLNSFQKTVHQFEIENELIEKFLHSMETDLMRKEHTRKTYEDYIYGSAEVVGLMCLRVFTENDRKQFDKLKPYAQSLGSAFQKVNFLRDLNADHNDLGRTYFPGVEMRQFSNDIKATIESEIEEEFRLALKGIRMLPEKARLGVYLAYLYYTALLNKIKSHSASQLLTKRTRVSNEKKLALMLESVFRYNFNLL